MMTKNKTFGIYNVRSNAVVLLLLLHCFIVALIVIWGSVLGPGFVIQYTVSFLVLHSSWWGRESWPRGYKTFFILTKLSINFQLPIKIKMLKKIGNSCL